MKHRYRSIILDEVGSTNTEAFAVARAGETGPVWIMARRQMQGRGRSGRKWVSEPGNLYASLLQTLVCPHAAIQQLSLLAGVAVIDAIKTAANQSRISDLRLKWPNDVLIGDAKCAGILPESHSGAASTITTVIGIGINLAWHPEQLDRSATHLAAHGIAVTPEVMLGHLAHAMEQWVGVWDRGVGFSSVCDAWRERGGPAGEAVTVDTGRERISGTYLDLDADGALLLQDSSGAKRRLTYGDVTIGRVTERGSV